MTAPSKRAWMRAIQIAVSLLIIVAVFAFVVPKIASYSSVWKTITSLTWLEAVTLVAAALFNLYTYWPQMTAAMPGLIVTSYVEPRSIVEAMRQGPFAGTLSRHGPSGR